MSQRSPQPTLVPVATTVPSGTASLVAVDRAAIMHTVHDQTNSTKSLKLGENATFVVVYHVSHPHHHGTTATLVITKNGKKLHKEGDAENASIPLFATSTDPASYSPHSRRIFGFSATATATVRSCTPSFRNAWMP